MPLTATKHGRSGPKRRPVSKRASGQRLTIQDRYQIVELHRTNPQMSYAAIADLCKCSIETARLTCIAATKDAVELMSAYSAPMLRKWITASTAAATRGDHRPAKDWLLHAGILDPLPDTTKSSGPAVVILNSSAMPGMPGTPVLEVRGTVSEVRTVDSAVDRPAVQPSSLPSDSPQQAGAPDALQPSDHADLEPDD